MVLRRCWILLQQCKHQTGWCALAKEKPEWAHRTNKHPKDAKEMQIGLLPLKKGSSNNAVLEQNSNMEYNRKGRCMPWVSRTITASWGNYRSESLRLCLQPWEVLEQLGWRCVISKHIPSAVELGFQSCKTSSRGRAQEQSHNAQASNSCFLQDSACCKTLLLFMRQ